MPAIFVGAKRWLLRSPRMSHDVKPDGGVESSTPSSPAGLVRSRGF
jgi:hypothetical protein